MKKLVSIAIIVVLLALCACSPAKRIVGEWKTQSTVLGVVVETNALFRADSVQPVCAGEIPKEIYGLIAPVVGEQELVVEAGLRRDLQLAYCAFSEDNLVQLSPADSKALFDEMVENTKSYLESYK